MKNLLRYLFLLLIGLSPVRPARATALPAPGRPLGEALNPDGTLRPGANGSFDARAFRMSTAPDGRPVFRPAGTTGAGDERWADGFAVRDGVDGYVAAIAKFGVHVYIGGSFTAAGNVPANCLAHWDGTAWSAMGTGVATNPSGALSVTALAMAPNGDVYAGGAFSQIGNVAANNVARWDGTAWNALGSGAANGTDGRVRTLVVASNGDVYAGGTFGNAGNVAAINVARWNGATWSSFGTGAANGVRLGSVWCLALGPNGTVYVGGDFLQAGGLLGTTCVAKWSGTAWSGLNNSGAGTGLNAVVYDMAVAANGDLYACGGFSQAGGAPANYVARWNGTAWNSLGVGGAVSFGYGPAALAIAASGEVYVSGALVTVGATTSNTVAMWNGTAWSLVPGAPLASVGEMVTTPAGDLYVGGYVSQAGGVPVNNIARLSGGTWRALGPGVGLGLHGYTVFDVSVSVVVAAPGGLVYVGGTFRLAGGTLANNVACWDGNDWRALGAGAANGTNGPVKALAVSSSGEVYVGGEFTLAGGAAANRVARWNGMAWNSLGVGAANGFNYGAVNGLALAPTGELYAGGSFDRAGNNVYANGIAKWDGTAWSAMGTGLGSGGTYSTGEVAAVAVAPNGTVYAGGSFSRSKRGPTDFIARWSGTAWVAFATGSYYDVSGPVSALAVATNGDVYVGGDFTLANGIPVNYLARWNGIGWSGVGTTTPSGINVAVTALALGAAGELYIGTSFRPLAGITVANRIAKWNGTAWSNLGTGLNGLVGALAVGGNGKLYAGGSFTATGDGSKFTARFAIYDPNAPLATKAARTTPAAQLFPNPAHGAATLRLPAGAPRLPLTLVDTQGRTVRRYPAPANAETNLDLRGLPAGTYVVRCGEYSQRLLVE
ncbi:T9SS type A sorting domain-containing protein [Hymenobacter properus]|uniref:T9SS type A sorting domain-containing protein n=1 Tax=Hymenobacter properus TaxID=2791026 RepID=A0A931BG46_9BACT|nr:T9SS type A sorting domain-containing protein [Hymenobacter properus]MBF9143304.1 T9SS type A sorting domain-containing protein [Hymenobacter properus]MBR7722114.1 T9SS type A sorting domain-containing protein [Microvirga sp. SRT04]